MLKKRPLEVLKKSEFVKLSEIAVLTGLTRSALKWYVEGVLFPAHTLPGKRAKYYRFADIRRILAAVAPMRAKGLPVKYCREEIKKLKWYNDFFNQ